MAEPFDDLLKKALAQAMEEDLRDIPADEEPMTDRQRRRMEALLADPAAAVAAAPRKRSRWRLLRFTAVAAAVALMTTSAIAYGVTGGAFFRDMFRRRAEETPTYAAYMDDGQVMKLGSDSVGLVVENHWLRLELVDAVCSGNTAMAAVRVTAKQLDSFPQDGDERRNYGFLDMDDFLSRGAEAFTASWRYVFSDEDPTLGDNECFLVLSVTGRSEIREGTYNILLGDFGWQAGDQEEVLYPGSFTIPVRLNGENGTSRTAELDLELTLGDYDYRLTEAVATPLSLTMEFTCGSGDTEVLYTFMEGLDGLTLGLEDGTVLDSTAFSTISSAGGTEDRWDVTVGLEFFVPLPAGAVQCLSMGGQTLELDLPALDQ